MSEVILAIDQGTTGTAAMAVNEKIEVVAHADREFTQHYPKPGWVEHDASEIWAVTLSVVEQVVANCRSKGLSIAAIGITNQRETTVLWDRQTLEPVGRAIVWQDRRTAEDCRKLKKKGLEKMVRAKTGLLLDPYFSGTKLAWLFRNDPQIRRRAKDGKLAFGTIESWIIAKLTGGRSHVTDATNASRTLLYNLKTGAWDKELLKIFDVPETILPHIVSNAGRLGLTKGVGVIPDGTPVTGAAGDQQAALVGQACFRPGMAKCTYGTGAFVLMNIGDKPVPSKNQLLTTVALDLNGKRTFALEGSAFIAGAAVQWLRDGLGLIKSADEIEAMAREVEDTGGVHFIPALAGLGAPVWDPDARGLFAGLTRGTNRGHIARAVLEGMAFQIVDLLDCMAADSGGKRVRELRVDGGAAQNDLLMQMQSDFLGQAVVRPHQTETTILGAAFLGGLGAGYWKSLSQIEAVWTEEARFKPAIAGKARDLRVNEWRKWRDRA